MTLGERISLYRPLTGELLHPELDVIEGADAQVLNGPGDIEFKVTPDWHEVTDDSGDPIFGKRKTLVVVERANGTIRQVGLVDELTLEEDHLTVSCGGYSMLAAQSGPWEGHQGYYVTMDPVTLFRRVWEQVQSYRNSDLGIRVTGSTSSGSSVGYAGSSRWRSAERSRNRLLPDLKKWEARLVTRERTLAQRKEAMFKAAGLKRVGNIHETENGDNPPDDPEWRADSTLWIRKDKGELGRWGRAHRWRNGRWVSQSQADHAVRRYRGYVSTVEAAKDEVDAIKYRLEPIEELLEKYEDEAKEEYSLYFWQNHDLGKVVEDLTAMGPFEFREEADWRNGDLDLQIRVGAPRVGVRRHELHLEMGVNILELPAVEYGELYTGVALFGAGEGSEVLSEQRTWNPKHAVRSILTETDKDAHTRVLVRNRANALMNQVRANAGLGFTDLVIHHDEACPEGSFSVGDELFVAGELSSGEQFEGWVRVLEMSHQWGSNTTSIEVEQI